MTITYWNPLIVPNGAKQEVKGTLIQINSKREHLTVFSPDGVVTIPIEHVWKITQD